MEETQDHSQLPPENESSDSSDSEGKEKELFLKPVAEVTGTQKKQPKHHQTQPEFANSKFLGKVLEYKVPIITNVWLGLLARYSLVKKTHPIIKGTMEFAEKTAYWTEQKAESLVTITRLNKPLKKIDLIALNGVVQIENTEEHVRNIFSKVTKPITTRIESATSKVTNGREWVRTSIYEPTHRLFDYVENKLEGVMLKKSEEKPGKPGLVNTIGRFFDFTIRFNLGMVNFAGRTAKDVTDKKNWENFYNNRVQPHTPSRVRVRQSIIYQEILKELNREAGTENVDDDQSYQENKELLEVDRKIIVLGQAAITRSKDLREDMKEWPSKAKDFGGKSFTYSKEALGHLSEARSLRDMGGIVLYEVRGVLMGAQNSFDWLRKSALLDGTISWMASQEKFLSNAV